MGTVEFGIPRDLVTNLAHTLGISAAVETGTFHGHSADALSSIFDRVWSVEIGEEFWKAAKARLGHKPGLTFLHGASPKVFPELLPTIDEPVLYWLDGHWCETAPVTDETQCPILDEIALIDAHPHAAGSAILIDDAQFHLATPPPPYRKEDWPTLLEVIDALRATHERYVTVLDDVIIAGPPSIREVVDGWWLRHHHYPVLHEQRDAMRAEREQMVRVPGGTATKAVLRKLVPESLRRRLQG